MKNFITWMVCFTASGGLIAQDATNASEKGNPSPTPAAAPAVQLVLELSDGSHIIGTPSVNRLKIATQYADVDVPLPRLLSVEFNGANHTAQLIFQNGDRLNGQLAATEIAIKTIFGPIVVPLDQMRRIRISRALPEGLVLYYSFDENDGGHVPDESGAGNDGTIHGAIHTNEGKVGGAMSFGGDGEVVAVGNPASLRLQDFTIMAWIKRGSAGKVSKNAIWGDLFGYTHGGYVFGIHDDGRLYMGKADPPSTAYSSFAIHDQAFHHVAVTKQGIKIVYYLDGVAYPSTDYNTNFEFNTTAAVGGRDQYNQNTFLGIIDEMAIFNRPLPADEVKKVYESQK